MTHKIDKFVDENLPTYQEIARAIHGKPEVSNYEFFASETLGKQLEAEGFDVTYDVAGHRTAFDARYKSGKPGPVVAFLAEYDALPGIGHACGHNLFGATSSLAGSAFKEIVDTLGGEVRVYGTPGEEGGENGSSKGSFVREGFLDDVDFALCAHPGHLHRASGTSLANDPVDIEFFGRASHASGAPERGINALDAIIQVYNGINALREHLSDDVRIHGVITNGGAVANVVPEYASARFYLRAASRTTLNDVYEKVENIVKGAALITGTTYKFGLFQNSVDDTIVVPSLDAVYETQLKRYGEAFTPRKVGGGKGSTDVGNISQVVPTIQPGINITDEPVAGHSIEFREASISDKGLESIRLGAKVLAHTAREIFEDPELLQLLKDEHAVNLKANNQ